MKLIPLYRAILDYCGLSVDREGTVLISDGDDNTKPFEVEGRILGLPTDEQFKLFDPDKRMIFHPLQEHINRGESEIVKTLRYHMNVRINLATVQLGTALLELAGSKALHARMTPEQRELLKYVPNVDIKSAPAFLSFMYKKFADAPASAVVNIFLKKSGTYKGEKHNRIGVVAFPYYELFGDQDNKLRNADKADFVTLMEYIYPGSKTDMEAFNAFSDSNDAPWLDAMLRSSYQLTSRLNEITTLFEDLFTDKELTVFNTTWIDPMDDIDSLRAEIRRIPSQAGNEGTVIKKTGEEQTTLKPAIVPTRPVPASRAPEPSAGPYREIQPTQQPVYPQPVYQQPVQQPVYQQPQPVYQAPIQQGPQLTENGKLDFRSISSQPHIAAAAPAAAAMAGWLPPGSYPQQMQMQPQVGYNGRAIAPSGAGYPPAYDRRMMTPMQQPMPVYPAAVQTYVDAYGRPCDASGRPLQMQPMPGYGISNI